MDCILRPLINEYKETFGRDLEKIAEFYSDIFHQTSVTKEAKAEIALIGSHQQYFGIAHDTQVIPLQHLQTGIIRDTVILQQAGFPVEISFISYQWAATCVYYTDSVQLFVGSDTLVQAITVYAFFCYKCIIQAFLWIQHSIRTGSNEFGRFRSRHVAQYRRAPTNVDE